ncbi:LysE family translocator [Jannaschia sp. CCS1]|uniref:LysE family translocator n=1 Tax=Jannaschia sp. (strain CCS1) TaxID=290400 RepID=UPI000053B581|nr:LysE family translocator [Jannaschia sp. CCS1]ABD54535.1 Lysine exporter protein (LYSE/YGGA) [Jannaschia sp. CCS1]
MTFEVWVAFAVASAIVVVIPGPNIVLTVTYAIRDGARSGLATVPGTVVGAFIAMTASLAGAGAILATSVGLFTVMKVAGAVYLLWLAYKLWTAPVGAITTTENAPDRGLWRLFRQSALISALNPKGPVFYMAFVPQFVDPAHPVFAQFVILTATFLAVAALNGMGWLVLAAAWRDRLRGPFVLRLINRIGAACLGAAGLFALRASRSAS